VSVLNVLISHRKTSTHDFSKAIKRSFKQPEFAIQPSFFAAGVSDASGNASPTLSFNASKKTGCATFNAWCSTTQGGG
jgi:hypothetical protein